MWSFKRKAGPGATRLYGLQTTRPEWARSYTEGAGFNAYFREPEICDD